MQPSIARVSEQLNPRFAASRHATVPHRWVEARTVGHSTEMK